MHVAVAMSGGVDSLRTAALLKQQGHEVIALHMRVVPEAGNADRDSIKARLSKETLVEKLAARLAIPLEIVDLRKEFNDLVIQPFLRAYREGLTPNPCVICNPVIKFGVLLQKAKALGAEKLATGHYVRLVPATISRPRCQLLRGKDVGKDQSYFLYGLSQEQLQHALFPLGASTKQASFEWAAKKGFLSLLSAESQEICFIPSGQYRHFMTAYDHGFSTDTTGPIVDLDGNILGEHTGVHNYTIGQRRGLGISSSSPLYVVALDSRNNTVTVGRNHDLFRISCHVRDVNWVSIDEPRDPIRARVRIRNQHRPAPATLTPSSEHTISVRFDTPQRAVTPGQSAVFYDDDVLLGGGTIVRNESE